MEPSDSELLASWRNGDKQAGTLLFRRYFRQVRRFFNNKVAASDVEELIQRTFTGIVEGRERFRDESSFRTYLFAVARRQFYRYLHDLAQRDHRIAADVGASSIAALGVTPGAVIDAQAEQRHVQEALQRIALPFQEILELHYWEGLGGPEIARILEIAPATARTRLHRARKALEEALGEGAEVVDLDQVARSLGEKM